MAMKESDDGVVVDVDNDSEDESLNSAKNHLVLPDQNLPNKLL